MRRYRHPRRLLAWSAVAVLIGGCATGSATRAPAASAVSPASPASPASTRPDPATPTVPPTPSPAPTPLPPVPVGTWQGIVTDRGEATGYTQTVTLRPCSVGEVCGTGTLVGKLRSGGAAITCDGTMELVDVRVLTERNDVMGGKLTFIFLENATAFTGPWRGCSSGILSYYQPNADGTALWMRVFNGDAPTAWGNLYRVDASQAPAASN